MEDYWRKRLKTLRENTGMNQGELSEKSGVARSQISMLENGTRAFTQKTIDAILGALGCTYHDLFTDTDPATTVPQAKTQETTQDNSPATETSSDNKMAAREAFYYVLEKGDDKDIAMLRRVVEESKNEIESKKKQLSQQPQMDKVLPRAA